MANNKGFTAIELIISIAVVTTLAALIISAFRGFRDAQVLNGSAEGTANLISEAHSNTLGSKKSLQHGIHIEMNRLVIFEGTVFSESNPANRELKISSQVEISVISLNGGGSDIVFQKLTGETSQYGMITLRLKGNPSKIKTVTVSQAGAVSIQ